MSVDVSLPSTATLELLTNDTRRNILTTLWAADTPLTFTTIREHVGTPDSGRFNYHLQRLTQRCVQKTPEGYVLTPRGKEFVEALQAVPALGERSETVRFEDAL